MTLCWSCERDSEDGIVCAHCGAVTPPRPGENHFDVLGLPLRFVVDLGATEARFRERSRQWHPDRFAKAEPRARQVSLQRSVHLNEAWRTIKHPVLRAEYLLKLRGYDVAGEGGATGPVAPGGEVGRRPRLPVSPVLLNEVLELREALAEARAAHDKAAERRLAVDVQARVDGSLAAIAIGFEAAATARPGSDAEKELLDDVAQRVIAVRYFQRILDEAISGDEGDEGDEGGNGDAAAAGGEKDRADVVDQARH